MSLQSEGELATKESPHTSYHPNVNTVYMIDFIRIITSIAMWLLDATYLLVTIAFFIEEIGVLGTTGSE